MFDPSCSTRIAIIGCGPAGLVAAIALARRGLKSTLIEKSPDPQTLSRFNPQKSYAIDITGHGLRALTYIDALSTFDQNMVPFSGIDFFGKRQEAYDAPGWIGSRGDIVLTLMQLIAERYAHLVTYHFDTEVQTINAQTGELIVAKQHASVQSQQADLILGADGAGSIVRQSLQQQQLLSVETKQVPAYGKMLRLDCVHNQLDKEILHIFSILPACIAGAVGERASTLPHWFCLVADRRMIAFSSGEQVKTFLQRKCPRLLSYVSDEALAQFASSPYQNMGRLLRCSQLFGGRVVLLGDAAAPFAPIGQGINAAMESAMVFDQCMEACIFQGQQSLQRFTAAARLYNQRWKPEADAVSWISERLQYGSRAHAIRALVTSKLGLSIIAQAKHRDLDYSRIRQQAQRLAPLWSW